jgi:site-specific DNA-cytosine methylase
MRAVKMQLRIETSFGIPPQKRKKTRRSRQTPDNLLQTPLYAPTTHMTQRKVVDLFACIGGFSTGANQAGHDVVLAVDCDDIALSIHAENHPKTMHKQMCLGPESEEELTRLIHTLIPNGCEWHLHGSPPCTKLSSGRCMAKRDQEVVEAGQEEGICLVDWFLDFMWKMQPTSWSMEQVNCKLVRNTLDARMRNNKSFMDYNVTHFVKYGVPQTRTRIIAGTPFLIHNIRFSPGMFEPTRSILNAIPSPPDGAFYMRSNWHRKSDESATEEAADGSFLNADAESRCRPLSEPSFTIMSHAMQWWTADYKCVRNLNTREMLSIQTFPPEYRFPEGVNVTEQHRGVGNAVPPYFAKKFMECSNSTGAGHLANVELAMPSIPSR